MSTPTRAELGAYLVSSRIAGSVATPRDNNLGNSQRMSTREPLYLFGMEPTGAWTPADVLALMAERCGVSPDPAYLRGPDTINVDHTLGRLDAMADRIHAAAQRQERVFVATGHPIGLRPTHTAVAQGLKASGCTLITSAEGGEHPGNP